MAYRYTGGLSLDDLLDIDPEQLMNMPEPALREAVSRMSQAANKRIRRASKAAYPSPAIQAAKRGGEFSVKDKDITALRNEYTRARGFLGNKLSTASGYREMQREVKAELKNKGYNVNLKDVPKMIDAYQKLTQEDGTVLTRGERYKYLRELGESVVIKSDDKTKTSLKDEAEATGKALLDLLADKLGDLDEGGNEFESDDGSVARFFRELE